MQLLDFIEVRFRVISTFMSTLAEDFIEIKQRSNTTRFEN